MRKLISLTVFAISAIAAGGSTTIVWDTGTYDPASWSAHENNLILGVEGVLSGNRFYEIGTSSSTAPIGWLTNAKVNRKGDNFEDTVGICDDASLSWTWDDSATVDAIRIFTHWKDGGRDGICVSSVEFCSAEDGRWFSVEGASLSYGITGAGHNSEGGECYAFLSRADGGPLAVQVSAVRINLGVQDNNGTGYTEIEVIGTPCSDSYSTSVSGVSWQYVLYGGTATIIGSDAQSGKIEVPATLDGYDVTAIGKFVFAGRAGITSVVLPDSLTTVGECAFSNCTALTSVTLPMRADQISPLAFIGCNKLAKVRLGGVFTGGAECVKQVGTTSWVTMAETLDGDAVYKSNAIGNNGATAIEFVTSTGAGEFVFSWKVGSEPNYDWLTWYVDGVSQTRISGNKDWATITNKLDGAVHTNKFVYSKDGSQSASPDCGYVSVRRTIPKPMSFRKMVPLASVREVSVAGNIESVPDEFFSGCVNLERVIISDGLKYIGKRAFEDCRSLSCIEMPSTIIKIDSDAFLRCGNLSQIIVPSLEGWRDVEFVSTRSDPLRCGAKLYVGSQCSSYTVDFDELVSDCDIITINVPCGRAIGVLPTAVRAGYVFMGWFTAETGGTLVTPDTIPSYNIRYYARWEQKESLDAPVIYAAEYFDSQTHVRITAEPGADIFYTLDGSMPTEDSFHYEEVFAIDTSVMIRAIAVVDGCPMSSESSKYVNRYNYESSGLGGLNESNIRLPSDETVERKFYIDNPSTFTFSLAAYDVQDAYSTVYGTVYYEVNRDGGYYYESGERGRYWSLYDYEDHTVTLSLPYAGYYTVTWRFAPEYWAYNVNNIESKVVSAKTISVPTSWWVKFDSDGGTSCDEKYYVEGQSYGELPIPTREDGDKFLGWYDQNGLKIEPTTMVGFTFDTIILKAGWCNVKRTLDPARTLDLVLSEQGEWAVQGSGPAVQWISDRAVPNGEKVKALSFVAQSPCVVGLHLGDYVSGCKASILVDGQDVSTYGDMFEIQEPGMHLVEVCVETDRANVIPSVIIFEPITISGLPNSVNITLDPAGGYCPIGNVIRGLGTTYAGLPEPTMDNCEFTGWYTPYGVKVESTDRVSMICDMLIAHWQVSTTFLDPDGEFDLEFNTDCNWFVIDSNVLECNQPEGGLGSVDVPLLTLHVSGAGLLIMPSFGNYDIRVDGERVDLTVRSIPVERNEYGDILAYKTDAVCEILTDGDHIVTLHASYLADYWYCYIGKMKWQPLAETVNVTLDPANGQVAQSNVICRVGGTYGELPVPTCDWGDFVGWHLDSCDGYGQDNVQFVNKDTRVSNLYTTLRAAYKVNGRSVDPDNNFDIEMTDEGSWEYDARGFYDMPKGRSLNWTSKTYYQWGEESPRRMTIMTFVPKQSGILTINGVRIRGGNNPQLNVRAYIGIERSDRSVDGPWLDYAYLEGEIPPYAEERCCWEHSYYVGVRYIEDCSFFVYAGQEYKLIVDMASIFSDWYVDSVWAGLSFGQFYIEPFRPVYLNAGAHGRVISNGNNNEIAWCRFSDIPVKQQLRDLVSVIPDDGWSSAGWSVEGDGEVSEARATVIYEPRAYDAWYLFDYPQYFPGGRFLPTGTWFHAQTYYSYSGQHYNQSSISGFYVSTNENDRVPNVCLLGKDNSTNWIENVVSGPCKVSFCWRASCESSFIDSEDEEHFFDYLGFFVDGELVDAIAGETEWCNRVFEIPGGGEHKLRWAYVKDESDFEGEDCGWIANIEITPMVEVMYAKAAQETGLPPDSVFSYPGSVVKLPGCGTLAWTKHRFVGWSDGSATYLPDVDFVVGTGGNELTAVWEEKHLAKPIISAPTEFAAKTAKVTIAAESGCDVYYTLDGGCPTSASTKYEGPFEISGSCVIKAIAIANDWYDSEIAVAEAVKASYQIIFDAGEFGEITDGEASQIVEYGDSAVPPKVTADDWHYFSAWDGEYESVTSDRTLTAVYGLKPWAVDDAEVYHDMGIVSRIASVYFDKSTEDWCAIKVESDGYVEVPVEGYARLTFSAKGNPNENFGIFVDGVQQEEVEPLAEEWGRRGVVTRGYGDHVVRIPGECWLADFEIEPIEVLFFAAAGGETGEPPAPRLFLNGKPFRLPSHGSLTYPNHRFVGWSDGDRVWGPKDVYDGPNVTTTLVAVWEEKHLAEPIIDAPERFEGADCEVSISAGEGASIYYTLDNSAPNANSQLYVNPFVVTASVTVKAIAVCDDFYDSNIAVKTITREPFTFGEYLGLPKNEFETTGNAEWVKAKGEGVDGGYALKSGVIGDSQTSVLMTAVSGSGKFKFSYRVSSEAKKGIIADGLSLFIDDSGVKSLWDGGDTGWIEKEIIIQGDGEHNLKWVYSKNAQNSSGADCAWLANMSWLPDTPVVLPDPGDGSISLGSPYRFAHKTGIMHSSEWYDGLPYEDYILHKGHIEGLANADTFVAIPVYGASAKDAIDPELSYIDASAADFGEVTVVDDKYLFDLIVAPILDKKEEWDNDTYTDFWNHGQTVSMNEYMLADMEKMMSRDFEWDATLWPDDKVVAGRHWILVQMNLPANRLGMAKFKVGLNGKDVLSDECCFLRMAGGDNIDGLATQGYFDSLCASKWFQLGTGANVGIDGKAQINFDGIPSHSVILPEFKVYNLTHDETFEFKLQIKEAGTLVMTSAQNDELPPNILTISGDNIISDAWRDRWSEGGFEYDIDRTLPDADDKYLEFQYRYGFANQMRKVEVSAGTTLTFTCEDGGSLEMPSMVFYPKTKKSVNVRAIHWVSSETDLYLRGVTTGSDVYCVGDEVVLRAYSGAGEEFVGWKVLYGSLPSGTDLTKKELRFTVTEDMCGTMAEERQLYVQALWSELPMDGMTIIRDVNEVRSVFGEHSEVAENITEANQLSLFNEFLAECGIKSVGSITPSQKQFAYKSFKLSEIMTAPLLFEEEPALKIDDIELTGGNLTLTISLTAGAEAIQLAKDKLAEKIRVGTTLDDITGKPTIVTSPAADGTSLTFTITPPEGNQGFVRVRID